MPPLVLIPGLGSDAAVWRPTIDALGDGYDAYVGDTLHDDSIVGMARRILADAPPHFALAGVSMGGMVAMEIMRIAPDRVARLALFDTSARPDGPEQTAQRLRANAALAATDDLAGLARQGVAFLIHPDAPDTVTDALVAMTLRVGVATYIRQNEALMARPDQRPVLATIAVPTIVVIGAEDRRTPMAEAETLRDGIDGAVLHVISDCGHLPPIERPEASAALLRDWLAGGA